MPDIVRLKSSARASLIVIYNGIVHLAGQVAADRSQPIREQTQEALAKIDALLVEAGTDRSRLLTAQIWLKDIARDFAGMNEVWEGWTSAGAAPTRATAQCEMGAPDVLIEILVTAAIGS